MSELTLTREEKIRALAELDAYEYAKCEKSLGYFIRKAWEVLEPGTPFLHNWHHDLIAEYLTAVHMGQIRKLIINMPPRNMKSISVTVCFPVWGWLHDPTKHYFCASYSKQLSTKHSIDRRDLISSPWFQRGWGDRFHFEPDQNQKTLYKNNHRGQMYSTSVGGGGTGEGGDIILLDDPINPKMAHSDALRNEANRWRDQTISTRKNNKKTAAEIIVMQRLHDMDPTGYVLGKEDPESWTVLKLEGIARKKTIIVFPLSKREIVREEGDYLHPEREGPEEHKQAQIDLGPAAYNAQYQQDPAPLAGGFFNRKWWRRYKEKPMHTIRRVQFWDCAEKPGITNDYSVCATWVQTQFGFYLEHIWRERVAFPELEKACVDLYNQHKPDSVVIEDKSAGTQLLQNLRAKKTMPLVEYDPGIRDKKVRAGGAAPMVAAGNCHIPEDAPWAEAFIHEHERFPQVDHDDQVDTTAMAIEFFKRGVAKSPRVRALG